MVLTTEKKGSDLIVHISGEVNTQTVPELDALLEKELPGVQALTLDFAECDCVTSAGLRVLLKTFKRMKASNGSMNFENVCKGIMDVFRITGLDKVFDLR